MRPRIYLKKNEEKRVKSGHPWVFSNEINAVENIQEDGDIVDVYDCRKSFIATGYFNSHSLIAVRILSRDRVSIDKNFFLSRLLNSLDYRKKVVGTNDAFRIVFGESDFIPGLIVDKYGQFLVIQFLTLGIEKFMKDIIDICIDILSPRAIILRNDSPFRKLEGLKQEKILLGGIQHKDLEYLTIQEGDTKITVDLWNGQKTGFFLDQRDNRDFFDRLNLSGKGLDCFCYSGAWGIRARESFKVICVDSSESAISLARVNSSINSRQETMEFIKEDVFEFLNSCIDKREFFDWIVLDPPAFVKNKKRVKEAITGYRELNRRAIKLLLPGGILITSSCSYNLREDMFIRLLKEAALIENREVRVIAYGGQSRDHPVLISMPESKYLKCIFLQIL